jgi:cellulose synthase/poly-beta-1,6-N-acetylglucosamine synthase-like glycosyltransferase
VGDPLISLPTAVSLIVFRQNAMVQFFQRQSNPVFRGLYQVDAFDLALLIPYFVVLIILAIYGCHRYHQLYQYYRFRSKKVTEPKSHFDELPRITVQLPIYNEEFMVDRLVTCICALDYPKDKLDIQLLDDSTDETVEVARAVVERQKALGHDITYIHRTDRTGFKAGALDNGLKIAKGEFVCIFDSDFTPSSDWLMKVIHHFAEPDVGMVQTRWTHINRHYSLLTEVESIMLDGHFVIEHGARARSGVFFNFNGTAGMWRLQAIKDAGGWEHDTLTEDTDLSYRCQIAGWRFVYLPDVECPAELPVEMTAFKTQQARWAKGLIQCAIKDLPKLYKGDIPRREKIEGFYHLTANLAYPLMIIFSVLMMPAMIIRSYQGWFQMLYIDLPLFVASTCSISSFYIFSEMELFPGKWYRAMLYLPCLMAFGIGLTITNSIAVMEALVGKKSAFVRTPKFRVDASGKKSEQVAKKYRKRLGFMPWLELLVGGYFALIVWYAMLNSNYFTVPFLILFVYGYWYTGLMSLFQGRFESLFGRGASTEEHSSKPFPVGV